MNAVSKLLPQSITGGHHLVNTGGICEIITSGHNLSAMAKDTKRKEPTPEERAEQVREGKALRDIFLKLKAEGRKIKTRRGDIERVEKLSQDSLGYYVGPMTQGMVSLIFKGERRLTKEQAVKFAEALDVPVNVFSPRLSAEIQTFAAAGIASQSAPNERDSTIFSAKMKEYRRKAIEKLLALPESAIDEWLKYADYLRTRDSPHQQQGGGVANSQ